MRAPARAHASRVPHAVPLAAAPPFYGKTDAEMHARVKRGQYKFAPKYWAGISADAMARRDTPREEAVSVFAPGGVL